MQIVNSTGKLNKPKNIIRKVNNSTIKTKKIRIAKKRKIRRINNQSLKLRRKLRSMWLMVKRKRKRRRKNLKKLNKESHY